MINLFKRKTDERAGEEVDDFSSYKVRVFKAVPPNMALICQNIFTGKPFVKTSGLVVVGFWVKSKMVSLARNTIDYPKEKYRTSDGIEVTVDLALVFSVVDPIKYEFNNNDPMQELKIKTRDKLRQYVASKTAEEMITGTHNLSAFDLNRDYELFTNETGLKVNDISFKQVELPQSMKDDYEKKAMQEMENARLLAEADAKKKVAICEAEARLAVAEKDAEVREKLGTADNKVLAGEIRNILDEIANMKTDDATKFELVKTIFLSNGDANLFYGMSNPNDVTQYLLRNQLYGNTRDCNQREQTGQPQTKKNTRQRTKKRPNS